VLCGGHSIRDSEIKFGFSVTGLVHPKKYWANAHARVGDRIILTKRIGTGIISTAIKSGMAGEKEEKMIAGSMSFLNRAASEAASRFDIRACTDITGFGLFGHALEVAIASKVCVEIDTGKVPLFPGVRQFLARGAYPGGGRSNFKYCACRLMKGARVSRGTLDIMLDPQTSGGLLIFVQPKLALRLLDQLHDAGIEHAAEIGRVTNVAPKKLIYR
jgi:selenide,water dikinase